MIGALQKLFLIWFISLLTGFFYSIFLLIRLKNQIWFFLLFSSNLILDYRFIV